MSPPVPPGDPGRQPQQAHAGRRRRARPPQRQDAPGTGVLTSAICVENPYRASPEAAFRNPDDHHKHFVSRFDAFLVTAGDGGAGWLAASGRQWQHARDSQRNLISMRRSSEPGHRRKFLVIIDESPECDRAVYFASRRARNTSGKLVMLFVMEPGDFQHWLGVENIMRAEAQDKARRVLGEFAEKARKWADIEPELVIREGNAAEEVRALINEDEDIAILALAAGTGKEGPGPLVSSIASRAAGDFPIPITIVPGSLSDEEIQAVS